MQTDTGTPAGGVPRSLRLDRLISRGATLFFEGTFGGNGRTCGTCHPASNNFTIDPAFIRTLPASDPLFVAEFNPTLAQLEKPQLMRQFGLVLENLDGLDDPANKFVMRGVPPTLGLQMTLEKDASLGEGPVQMTGWSGDGSPGTGSLREFAIGAVTQHFTRRLARVPGRDFRLPTEHQLDAMEAFQLSLGRFTDVDLSKITFLDGNVRAGRTLFTNGTGNPNAAGTCGFCHANGGALSINGQNRNFNTSVEGLVHPARAVQNFPKDGGFGQGVNSEGTFGNGTFNIASVVEAADTGPFFHNNAVNTLEEVVEFYAGPAFQRPVRAPFGPVRVHPRPGRADFRFHACDQRPAEHRDRQARVEGNHREPQRPAPRAGQPPADGDRRKRRLDRHPAAGKHLSGCRHASGCRAHLRDAGRAYEQRAAAPGADSAGHREAGSGQKCHRHGRAVEPHRF